MHGLYMYMCCICIYFKPVCILPLSTFFCFSYSRALLPSLTKSTNQSRESHDAFNKHYHLLKKEIDTIHIAYPCFQRNLITWNQMMKINKKRRSGNALEACTMLLDMLMRSRGRRVFQTFVEILNRVDHLRHLVGHLRGWCKYIWYQRVSRLSHSLCKDGTSTPIVHVRTLKILLNSPLLAFEAFLHT